MQCTYIPFLFLIHCFPLLPYEASPDSDYNSYNVPNVKVQMNHYNPQPSNNCYLSAHVNEIPDYSYKLPVHYSVLAHASPGLRDFFRTSVFPLMYDAMIKNHHVAIPGYTFSEGLRHCIYQLSQFSCSDAALIASIAKRLETYCSFTEGILFNGKNHSFCDVISHKDQVQLVRAYADFLKEFYVQSALGIFYHQSQDSPLMQQVMPSINWSYYNGNDLKSNAKKIEQRQAASLHGNLGVVYKLLHEGDIEKAYVVGHESVKTVVHGKLFGKTEQMISVFERYPLLYEHVKQVYSAHKAHFEQERLIKQDSAQKGAVIVQVESSDGIQAKVLIPGSDVLQQRNNAAIGQVNNPEFFKKMHTVLAEQADCINIEHLTSDRKGILLNGGYLQHHIVDEAITVVDAVISNDLSENVQDAVLGFANVSLTVNKDGDVVMATRALDACWALIDYAHHAAHYTYTIASTHLPLVAKGACDGVCESLHGVMHTVCHPVEAAENTAQSLAVAGYYLGKALYKAGEYESMIDLIETESHSAQETLQKLADEPSVLSFAYEYAKKNISSEDVARVGTKTALDMMLLHGVTKAVSAIAQETWAEFISCMRKGEQSSDIALTVENISVQCGEEIASAMESMQKTGGGTEATAGIKRYGKEGSPYQKISKSTQRARPLDRLEGKDLIGIENVSVSGYGTLPKRIYLDKYKHYLQPELRTTSTGKLKPSGWHHDPGRRLESIKRINGHKIEIINYEKHASGIYKFEWGVEGMRKKQSTFFPHTWSREVVQQKIVEAYKYARKYKIQPKLQVDTNNFSLHGFTCENIKIEMIINQKGQLITVYPVFPK